MEEEHKEWYYTSGPDQAGPVTFEELKKKAAAGELHPRNDMVWKESMDEWVPAGQIDDLFQKRMADAAAEALAASISAMEETKPPQHEDAVILPGASRRWFLLFVLIFPFVWVVLCTVFATFTADKLSPGFQKLFLLVGVIVPVWVVVDVSLSRLTSLGMSKLWFLVHFIPVANLWLWYRCFACPPGYAKTKKLGGVGWFLAIVYWLFIISAVAAGIVVPTMFATHLKESGALEKLKALAAEVQTVVENKTESIKERQAREIREREERSRAKKSRERMEYPSTKPRDSSSE
jgi:hypothetical protein